MFKSLLYIPAVPLPYKITFWKKLIKVLQSNSLHRMLRSVKSKGVKNLLSKVFLIAFSWLLLYYQRFFTSTYALKPSADCILWNSFSSLFFTQVNIPVIDRINFLWSKHQHFFLYCCSINIINNSASFVWQFTLDSLMQTHLISSSQPLLTTKAFRYIYLFYMDW